MSVKSLSQSSLLDNQWYKSMLAGNTAFLPGAYYLLETQILTDNQASVTFDNLSSTYGSTYQHLQIIATTRSSTVNNGNDELWVQLNSDTASNYSWHFLYGSDGSVGTYGIANKTEMRLGAVPRANITANVFSGTIIDILDPFETTKHTTCRAFNATTGVGLYSGAWRNTAAVTDITLKCEANFVTGSGFFLYGIRSA